MKLTRTIAAILTLISIALTWLLFAGLRTAALLIRALGEKLGAELLLPARMLQPSTTAVLVILASAGSLLLIIILVGKMRQEIRTLLLSSYLCLLVICVLIGFIVSILQVHTLLFPPLVPGINF